MTKEFMKPVYPIPQGHRRIKKLLLSFAVPLLFISSLAFHGSSRESITEWLIDWNKDLEENTFQWADIEPSKQLKYTPCFDGFQCARLDVPLNWNASDLNAAPRAAIAIVKLAAKVPVTDARYGGAILTNPGGPGESGVHQVLSGGKHIQTLLDSPGYPSSSLEIDLEQSSEKYFDIISFDPRGVNNTTPRLRCFPNAFNQQAWLFHQPDYSHLWDSESILGLEWARAEALGQSCSREKNENDMVRHANTAQVIEDMVEIIERHAEWRENEAESILKGLKNDEKTRNVIERTAWKKGKEMLQYWGFSYGTVIGSTFAAMHPDRVGRVILDGVVDPADHYSGGWMTQLQDTDKIITKFCEYCFEAGRDKCPLFTGDSVKDIEVRVEQIMSSLRENPIPVPASDTRGPEVVLFGDVYLMMLSAMYFSHASAESFFTLLAQLDSVNATSIAIDTIATIKQGFLKAEKSSHSCHEDGPFSDACVSSNYISGIGASQSIFCMDMGGKSNLTKEGFKEYLGDLRSQSKWISRSWARNKISCIGYTVQPAWTFDGPIAGNTSNPILLIGNSHDTVTPIRNARRVSSVFPTSRVLHHDSEGHCSYSNPSICTGKAIRAYFHSGVLPDSETICTPEYRPFIGCVHKDADGKCRKLDDEDEGIWAAMESITTVWP